MTEYRLLRPLAVFLVLMIVQVGLSAQVYQKPAWNLPAEASESDLAALLALHYPILAESGSELRVLDAIQSPGGRHIRFEQVFGGIPVYGAGLKLNRDKGGKIQSVMNGLRKFSGLPDGRFSLDVASYRTELLQREGAYRADFKQVYRIADDELQPSYRIWTFSDGAVASFEILVDGRSGEEISRKDRSAYFGHATTGDTTGRGIIFLPNPSTSGNLAYGELIDGLLLVDYNDNMHPVFDLLVDTVTLQGITIRNDSFFLEGPYVRIEEDIAAFFTAKTFSLDGDFFFTRDTASFEDVMVYYHIDSYQRYVQSLGFSNLQNLPLRVDPHGLGNADQSVYVADGANSYIKLGDGGVDDAEDADVIVHEYGHALADAASPDTRTGTERIGLEEGYGDYFAASYSYDLDPFDWELIFNWDGHNEFWQGRDAASAVEYPPQTTNIYSFGIIWLSTMMDVRFELGAQVTDRLIFQSLYHLYNDMTLTDAARVILDVDTSLYAGAHSSVLSQAFCEHKLFSGAECEAVGIAGDLEDEEWNLISAGTAGEFLLIREGAMADHSARLSIIDMSGRLLRSMVVGPVSESRIFLDLTPGLYLARLESREGKVSSLKFLAEN